MKCTVLWGQVPMAVGAAGMNRPDQGDTQQSKGYPGKLRLRWQNLTNRVPFLGLRPQSSFPGVCWVWGGGGSENSRGKKSLCQEDKDQTGLWEALGHISVPPCGGERDSKLHPNTIQPPARKKWNPLNLQASAAPCPPLFGSQKPFVRVLGMCA